MSLIGVVIQLAPFARLLRCMFNLAYAVRLGSCC
jgi:hypothetical protein